jgi:hypothetical protein
MTVLSESFVLTAGGPWHRLISRLGLTRSVGKRIALVWLLTWPPLIILLTLQGLYSMSAIWTAFANDIALHVRFLFAVPLLMLAEVVVDHAARVTIGQFDRSGMITPDDQPRFDSAIRRAIRMRDSMIGELVVLALAYTSILISRQPPPAAAAWIKPGGAFSAAGWWYVLVSIPIFQFLLYRWLWKYLIWAVLMRRISRLDLRLAPAHPDRVGGLAFVSVGQTVFALIVLAASAVLAGIIGNVMIHGGAALASYKIQVVMYAALMLVIFLMPLMFFTIRLTRLKLTGLRQYGALGSQYAQGFQDKWITSATPPGEPLLGTSDIQALADLNTSYWVVRDTKMTLVTLTVALAYITAVLLPMLPLLLLEIPADVLARAILRALRGILG